MKRDAALLIVDVQNDFCPDGALAIHEGDRVVEPLSRVAEKFAGACLPIFASRDWHPPVTGHFAGYGGRWPHHCVQGSHGAAFHPALRLPPGTMVVSKGSDPDSDAYSVFDGECEDGISLMEILGRLSIRHLYIGGLATDYCVRSSTLDAINSGFEVTVLTDAIAGVDLVAGDSDRALDEMRRAGVNLAKTDDV